MNNRIVCVVVSVFVVLFLSSAFIQLARATENTWTTDVLMPTARYDLGVATVNGKIFAIGGHKPNVGVLGINQEYDPVTAAWTTKNSMPTSRESFGIAVWQGKIYIFGGLAQSGMTASTQVYDPATDSWTTKASSPTKRVYFSANVVNDKIYLIGGQTSPSNLLIDRNEVYDPVTDSWITKTPLPIPVSGYASAIVDGKIYVLGGHGESGTTDLNQVYDPAADAWSNKTRMPNGVEFAAAGATSGVNATKMMYVFGGTSSSDLPTDHTMVYNPGNDTWITGEPMPTSRSHLAVGVLDERLFAIGGIASYALGTNEEYTPIGYIPEFPSFLALPLFVTAALLVSRVGKRRFSAWLKNPKKSSVA